MTAAGRPVSWFMPVLAFAAAALATVALRDAEADPVPAPPPVREVVAVIPAPRLGDVPDLPAPLAPARRRPARTAKPTPAPARRCAHAGAHADPGSADARSHRGCPASGSDARTGRDAAPDADTHLRRLGLGPGVRRHEPEPVTSVPRMSAWSPRRTSLLLLIATIAAAAAGVALATRLAPQDAAAPAPAAADSSRILTGDITRLPLPEGWEPRRSSRLPGLEHAQSARGLYSDVAIDTRMPDDPSLLPATMLRALGTAAPDPQRIRSGNRVAWAYHLSGPEGRTSISALVLPTTGGVVTIACLADAALSPFELTDCEAALARLELVGAAPLRPAPETAVELVAGPVIARLDDERTAARQALATAGSPARREALALRLAAAYGAAARRLEPLARGKARPLPRALAELARDYRALARASADRFLRAARRAGKCDRPRRARAGGATVRRVPVSGHDSGRSAG